MPEAHIVAMTSSNKDIRSTQGQTVRFTLVNFVYQTAHMLITAEHTSQCRDKGGDDVLYLNDLSHSLSISGQWQVHLQNPMQSNTAGTPNNSTMTKILMFSFDTFTEVLDNVQ